MKKLLSGIALSTTVVGSAYAQAADGLGNLTNSLQQQGSQQGSSLPSILMLVVFLAIFYFLLIRPQMRRTKEQRQLMSSLEKGDEVVTTSGIFGKVSKVEDTFIILTIANGVDVKIQKQAVASMLPKGSVDA
jgi:preprotein translocase subunit YajC